MVKGKGVKIWFGRLVGQTESAVKPMPISVTVYDRKSKTLKGLCDRIGVSYNTAKVKQDKEGGITAWVNEDKSVWHVWVEMIGR